MTRAPRRTKRPDNSLLIIYSLITRKIKQKNKIKTYKQARLSHVCMLFALSQATIHELLLIFKLLWRNWPKNAHIQLLGVTISKDLRWDPHCNKITRKANHTLGLLRRTYLHVHKMSNPKLIRPQFVYSQLRNPGTHINKPA